MTSEHYPHQPNANDEEPGSSLSPAEQTDMVEENNDRSSHLLTAVKLFYSAGRSFAQTWHHSGYDTSSASMAASTAGRASAGYNLSSNAYAAYSTYHTSHVHVVHGRRLTTNTISKDAPPSYMKELFEDLKARKKLMEETPPEEVKYWFEYSGPLQVR